MSRNGGACQLQIPSDHNNYYYDRVHTLNDCFAFNIVAAPAVPAAAQVDGEQDLANFYWVDLLLTTTMPRTKSLSESQYRYKLSSSPEKSLTDKFGIEWKYHRACEKGPSYAFDGKAEIHTAAEEGLVDSLAFMLAAETHGKGMLDMRTRDGLNSTPMHLAAVRGNLQIIRWLLESGADRKAVNARGQSINDCVIFSHRVDVVRYVYSQNPVCGPTTIIECLLAALTSGVRGDCVGAGTLLGSMTRIDYQKKQTDSLSGTILGWSGMGKRPTLQTTVDVEQRKSGGQARMTQDSSVCLLQPLQKKFSMNRDTKRVTSLSSFGLGRKLTFITPQMAKLRPIQPEKTEEAHRFPEAFIGPNVEDSFPGEQSIFDVLKDGNYEVLLDAFALKLGLKVHDEIANLLNIFENCLQSRYGCWRLCALQQRDAASKPGLTYRGTERSLVNMLLECLTDKSNESVQKTAIHAVELMLSCPDDCGKQLLNSFCADAEVLSMLLQAVMTTSSARVKVSGLVLLNKLTPFTPERTKMELLESSIVTKALSNTLRFQSNAPLQMQSSYLLDTFVENPLMASTMLQKGLLDAISVICGSIVASVRDYAANTFNSIADKVPDVVWLHLQDKHEVEQNFVSVKITYLESFLNIIRDVGAEDENARLLTALWKAANGRRNNQFYIYRTTGIEMWLSLVTVAHHLQRTISLKAINELIIIGTNVQRGSVHDSSGIHTLLQMINDGVAWEVCVSCIL